MIRPFKLLVFDWDGTLMDSEERIVACMADTVRDLALPDLGRDRMKDIIGLGLRESLEALFPGRGEAFAKRFIERYRFHYLDAQRPPSLLFPGVVPMLHQLHAQGYWLAVATGKGRRGLDDVLHRTGTDALFHVTRCADEAPSKPHPGMLLDILDHLGVEPHAAVMIGDTEYDMEMARNAATAAVAVTYGVHAVERLVRHRPLACLQDIRDLPAWLGARSAATGTST